jgi:hypothetical protein
MTVCGVLTRIVGRPGSVFPRITGRGIIYVFESIWPKLIEPYGFLICTLVVPSFSLAPPVNVIVIGVDDDALPPKSATVNIVNLNDSMSIGGTFTENSPYCVLRP